MQPHLEFPITQLPRCVTAAESRRDVLVVEAARGICLCDSLAAEIDSLKGELLRCEHDRVAREQSLSWRMTRRLAGAANRIAPPGTARRQILRIGARLVEIGCREGVSSMPGRFLSRANECLAGVFAKPRFRRMPWTPDDRPVFLQVHHGLGGGIERHLRDLCSWLRGSGVRTVLVAPGPRGSLRWEETCADGPANWHSLTDASPETIDGILDELEPVHAHVHSVINVPPPLIGKFSERRLSFDWTVHDHHSICPRAHLDQDDGRYCGEPDASGCNACLARRGDQRGGSPGESIDSWRDRHEAYLRRARRVFAPSRDTKRRIQRYFPGIEVVVRPHPEPSVLARRVAAEPKAGVRLRVAVIGTITTLKGSRLLQSCAEDAARNDRPIQFIVLGRTDRDAALARTGRVTLTGPFREEEIFDRLEAAGCQLALLPSVVPETYMYTLSIAIRGGLFPVCLDLGAQAERVREFGRGLVICVDASPAEINQAMLDSAGALGARPNFEWSAAQEALGDPIGSYYGFTDEERRRLGLPPAGEVPVAPQHHFVGRDAHARLH